MAWSIWLTSLMGLVGAVAELPVTVGVTVSLDIWMAGFGVTVNPPYASPSQNVGNMSDAILLGSFHVFGVATKMIGLRLKTDRITLGKFGEAPRPCQIENQKKEQSSAKEDDLIFAAIFHAKVG